ncbi:aspartate kinase [Candidatus Hecatella orcuttiae]|jgi:aspartate kinase|uniref:aspartate kinase n=1 Tax=Candidatus Hecatella orcuttiae TaxID=1935119 RepID=UPI002867B337|nr:aspartate kinase [Candidatus Hecatella orcuttiae]
MPVKTLVVKFGGSCLSTPENIAQAAGKVAAEARKGKKILVVVSALTGVTDGLLQTALQSSPNGLSKEDLDEVLSMGERTAARIMTTAIKSQGVKAVGLDPSSSQWPIYTDSEFGQAEVNLEKTQRAVLEKVKPLLEEGYVVVVPGFIGLSPQGKVTTLGRGGSDITAVVLGRCVGSDEVVFVKDVQGVLSADPKKVTAPAMIESLDVEEMFTLGTAGAKVLHPKSLKYKTDFLTLRVVGFEEEDLAKGTVIKGVMETRLSVALHHQPLSMVSLVGWEVSSPETLLMIFSEAASTSAKILGLTLASPSLLLYVENPSNLLQRLHELIKNRRIAKAVHSLDPIALITVSGPELEKAPGIVNAVVAPLAREGINLLGVMTISSSVRVFLGWKDREKALTLIKENVEKLAPPKAGVSHG